MGCSCTFFPLDAGARADVYLPRHIVVIVRLLFFHWMQVHEQMSAYQDTLRSLFIFYSCVASRFGEARVGVISLLITWRCVCMSAQICNGHAGLYKHLLC